MIIGDFPAAPVRTWLIERRDQKVGKQLVSSSHGWFNLINAVILFPHLAFTTERSTQNVSAWQMS